MPRKKTSHQTSLDQHLAFANAILASLAQSDETLTKFEFEHIDRSGEYCTGEYHIPDLEIALVRDGKRILDRLREAKFNSVPIAIGATASFKNYREFDTQLIHYVCIQPFNVLLHLEASVNSDEWENNIPVALYGNIHSYRDKAGLKKHFDSYVKQHVTSSIDFSIRHFKEALSPLGESARAAATRRIISRLEKLLP